MAKEVSEAECRASIQEPYKCGNNTMLPHNGVYSFDQSPEGEGIYMSVKTYQILN